MSIKLYLFGFEKLVPRRNSRNRFMIMIYFVQKLDSEQAECILKYIERFLTKMFMQLVHIIPIHSL